MYRILLAEDEITLREVVEVFFRKNGFEIDATDNGTEFKFSMPAYEKT